MQLLFQCQVSFKSVFTKTVLLLRAVTVHYLAALDLGAGVEQPFDRLIVHNRQDVQCHGTFLAINREPLELEICSSTLRIRTSSIVSVEKHFQCCVWGSL